MQGTPVGYFVILMGSAAGLGALGLCSGFTAIVCLKRGGIRGRSGRLYFARGTRLARSFVLMSILGFAVWTSIAGCAVYSYASDFIRQGTWPVADHPLPRRGVTAR